MSVGGWWGRVCACGGCLSACRAAVRWTSFSVFCAHEPCFVCLLCGRVPHSRAPRLRPLLRAASPLGGGGAFGADGRPRAAQSAEEPNLYAFYIADQEVAGALAETVAAARVSTEGVVAVVYQPLAVPAPAPAPCGVFRLRGLARRCCASHPSRGVQTRSRVRACACVHRVRAATTSARAGHTEAVLTVAFSPNGKLMARCPPVPPPPPLVTARHRARGRGRAVEAATPPCGCGTR